MSPLTTAVWASAEAGEGAVISPYVFGGVALGVLVLLLLITMLINVDR
ncbi:MAG: hypothetical protein ACO3ID_11570 [Candidatus Nanopelagicales bacterium]|jgi:hypothetical protein